MSFEYQKIHSFEHRVAESNRIRKKYPDRIPVIFERIPNSNISILTQNKFLVPDSLSVAQLIYVVRRRIKLDPSQSIFVFINDSIPCSSDTLNELYHKYGQNDGFLYFMYGSENTFGNENTMD